MGCRGRMVVGFTTTNAISAYHHREFESRSWWGVLDTTLCDKVCQLLAAGLWFSPVSSINKTDSHELIEILLKVALNTIILTIHIYRSNNEKKCNQLWKREDVKSKWQEKKKTLNQTLLILFCKFLSRLLFF